MSSLFLVKTLLSDFFDVFDSFEYFDYFDSQNTTLVLILLLRYSSPVQVGGYTYFYTNLGGGGSNFES